MPDTRGRAQGHYGSEFAQIEALAGGQEPKVTSDSGLTENFRQIGEASDLGPYSHRLLLGHLEIVDGFAHARGYFFAAIALADGFAWPRMRWGL